MLAHMMAFLCVAQMLPLSVDLGTELDADVEVDPEVIESAAIDGFQVPLDGPGEGEPLPGMRSMGVIGDDLAAHGDRIEASVDINHASAIVLAGLPGIGPREAQAIVAGRPYPSLQALVARNILDAERLEALLDLLYVGAPAATWASQAQSRTWWRDGETPAAALGVNTALANLRGGMAVTTQPPAWQPIPAVHASATALHDGFVQWTRGPHAGILGYYDIGFANRLTFDTTPWLTPDGIHRGALTLEGRRPPKLLGGAYAWQQHPSRAGGVTAMVFAATHFVFHQVGGAHIGYAWDARRQLSITGYAARGDVTSPDASARLAAAQGPLSHVSNAATTHLGVGVAARLGSGLCDLASEGAMTGEQALAYSLQGICEPRPGWRVGVAWRDLDVAFNNPFSRADRGRPASNRRLVGAWTGLRAAPWQTALQVDASWPRACVANSASAVATPCPVLALAVRQEARLALRPRHALRATAHSWRGKQLQARWDHKVGLFWTYGGTHGWAGAWGTIWQHSEGPHRPAHVIATARLAWRRPTLSLHAYAAAGLDAAHWRGGLGVAHHGFAGAAVQVRVQMGQASAAQPMRHSALLLAKLAF